uniref:Uncharacterized protein n=1 Tax=Solanum lycopersicum TaxID=4081 RepID=A0A3Q7G2G7_SOLLC
MTKPDPNPTLFTLPIPFSKREKRKTQNIIPSTHFFPSSHAQCKNPNETLHATATAWPQKPSRVTRLHLSVDSAARLYEFQRKAKYLYERAERCGTISVPLSFLGKIELLPALCHWKNRARIVLRATVIVLGGVSSISNFGNSWEFPLFPFPPHKFKTPNFHNIYSLHPSIWGIFVGEGFLGVKFSSGNVFVNKKKTERLFCERERHSIPPWLSFSFVLFLQSLRSHSSGAKVGALSGSLSSLFYCTSKVTGVDTSTPSSLNSFTNHTTSATALAILLEWLLASWTSMILVSLPTSP